MLISLLGRCLQEGLICAYSLRVQFIMERDHSRGSIRQLVASSYQETDEMNIGSQSTSIFIFSLELHLLEWYFPCLKQVFSLSSVKTATDMLTFVSWGLLGLVKLTVNSYHNVIHCQLETQTYDFSFIFMYILMASTRETQFFWKKRGISMRYFHCRLPGILYLAFFCL